MMNSLLKRFWNFSLLSVPKGFAILITVGFIRIYEKVNSLFWTYNLKECGKNVFIQKGVSLRFPGNISIKNNVIVGRDCQIDSEFANSTMLIESNTQINKSCIIDF